MSSNSFESLSNLPGHISSFTASSIDGNIINETTHSQEEAKSAVQLIHDATELSRHIPALQSEKLKSVTESIANRILVVGGHPLQLCFKHPNEQHRNHTIEDHEQVVVVQQQQQSMITSILRTRTTITAINNHIQDDAKEEEEQKKNIPYYCGCRIDSPMYSRCWPFLFLFSAITDFPFPLPIDKKPRQQHRYWGWVSVFVVLSIIAFLYYGYIFHLCLTLIYQGSIIQVTIYLISVHLLLLFLLTSYARIVTKKPGTPKKTIVTTMMKRNDIILQQETRSFYKSILPQRWCDICQWWKPDRAHHCRVCNTCILRMDHHCQWVNGCVGFDNYRYFIQFIFYTSGTSFWPFTTSLTAFIMGNGLLNMMHRLNTTRSKNGDKRVSHAKGLCKVLPDTVVSSIVYFDSYPML
ncbi:hypothetical protein INT45_006560 [Circinella minor]|uniref:Palmitoyltransferase n=1 Tax=Circinella minor TaxID=1195481 RepID=A0A8H7VMT5_9FUNG|nr:hypothetical protein INT45_006560 [Circinella minor]